MTNQYQAATCNQSNVHLFMDTADDNRGGFLFEDTNYHLLVDNSYDEDFVMVHKFNGENFTPEMDEQHFEEDEGIECLCDDAAFGMFKIGDVEVEAYRIQDDGYYYYILHNFDYTTEIDTWFAENIMVECDV